MQVTIPQHALARELALLTPLANGKSTIPILSNVRMEATADGLTLTATNLEQGVTVTIPCDVRAQGAITVHCRKLADLVARLSGDITLTVDDKQYLTVRAGRSRSRFGGMSAESFPTLPAVGTPLAEMDARALARHFKCVAFAISAEESRFTLNGALLAFADGKVLAVATDGHRLAYAEMDGAAPAPANVLVPKPAITAFANLADAAEGGARVVITQDENHLFFAVGPRLLTTRKMSGNFPDYARVLPKHETYVTVDRDELKAALTRVAQFSDERSRAVRFAFSSGEVALFASSMDTGESAESVSCDGGAEVEVGFNAQYILDALGVCNHAKVAVYVKDAKSAGELRPMVGAGTTEDPYRASTGLRVICMPMRL